MSDILISCISTENINEVYKLFINFSRDYHRHSKLQILLLEFMDHHVPLLEKLVEDESLFSGIPILISRIINVETCRNTSITILRKFFNIVKKNCRNVVFHNFVVEVIRNGNDIMYYVDNKKVRQNVNVLYYLAKYNRVEELTVFIEKYGNRIDVDKENML